MNETIKYENIHGNRKHKDSLFRKVQTVRKYESEEKLSLGDAITVAIDECIEKGILSDILIEERAEVHMYILETFDKELYEKELKEDAYEDGKKEGKIEAYIQLVKNGVITIKTASEYLEISEEQVENYLKNTD